jgi:tRNA uridine 5-carbamoylmethylation protein Kti12
MRNTLDKGFRALYVLMVVREMIPSEYIADFSKNTYGIVANDPNTAAIEIAKAVVEHDDVDRIAEEARKYLVSIGLIVDIISMSPEEIRREFENDQKYPDVESIRRKLPKEFRSIVTGSIKKKQTAINKIVKEIEKLKGIRRLSGSKY